VHVDQGKVTPARASVLTAVESLTGQKVGTAASHSGSGSGLTAAAAKGETEHAHVAGSTTGDHLRQSGLVGTLAEMTAMNPAVCRAALEMFQGDEN